MPSCRLVTILSMLLVALAGSACSKDASTTGASNAAPATAAPAGDSAAPPAAMPAHETTAPAPAMPAGDAAAASAAAPAPTATGKVIETMDAAGYTYVRLDTGTEKIWAATAPIKVKVGQMLTVPLEMPMQNFHSQALGRDFPLIYFASRVSRGREPLPPRPAMPTAAQRAAAGPAPGGQPMPAAQGASPAQAPGQTMPPGHPPIGAGANAPSIKVTEVIPPAPGGRSVADVWKDRSALAGKTIVVRGKVVKFLSGIMGRNWVHLQDGTGNAKDGSNDLTVTTTAEAKPGDVLTATGTLAIDKDFGAGYKYGAIVEGATLSK